MTNDPELAQDASELREGYEQTLLGDLVSTWREWGQERHPGRRALLDKKAEAHILHARDLVVIHTTALDPNED